MKATITILPYSNKHEKTSFMKINPTMPSRAFQKEKIEERAVRNLDRKSVTDFIVPDAVNENGRVWSF